MDSSCLSVIEQRAKVSFLDTRAVHSACFLTTMTSINELIKRLIVLHQIYTAAYPPPLLEEKHYSSDTEMRASLVKYQLVGSIDACQP